MKAGPSITALLAATSLATCAAPRISRRTWDEALAGATARARQILLRDSPAGLCRSIAGPCGDLSSTWQITTSDGFVHTAEYFNPRGELIGRNGGGCVGPGDREGAQPACSSSPQDLDLCARALETLTREAVELEVTCPGHPDRFSREHQAGRSSLLLTAPFAPYTAELEVPRSFEQPVALHPQDLSQATRAEVCETLDCRQRRAFNEDLSLPAKLRLSTDGGVFECTISVWISRFGAPDGG